MAGKVADDGAALPTLLKKGLENQNGVLSFFLQRSFSTETHENSMAFGYSLNLFPVLIFEYVQFLTCLRNFDFLACAQVQFIFFFFQNFTNKNFIQ